MGLNEMIKIIREYFPEKAVELSESLELLQVTLEDTRQDIKNHIMLLFDQGKHEAMVPQNQLASAILEYTTKIQELQTELEPEEQPPIESNDDEEMSEAPNYEAYAVDSQVVHTLRESFTFTRPAAFELNGKRIEARTWHAMLIKTCEFLWKAMGLPDTVKLN